MDGSSRIVVAILSAAALTSGVVLWVGLRVERRLGECVGHGAGGEMLGHLPAPPGTAPSATLAPRVATPVSEDANAGQKPGGLRMDRAMTYDFFRETWTGAHALRAEKECWLPLEAAREYPSLTSAPQFEVEVHADGTVADVVPQPVDPGESPKLYSCLAGVIRSMRFPPAGQRHRGPVQADRPPKGR